MTLNKTLAIFISMALWAADPSTFDKRKAGVRDLLARHDNAAALTEAAAMNREWPDDVAGYQLLAAAHLGMGNYKEAEAALQWMLNLRIGKTDGSGWLLVARFREATGDIDGAIDALNSAYAKLAPGDEGQRTAMQAYSGHLLYLAGRIEDAERVLHPLAGRSTAAQEALARVRIAQGRSSEARAIFQALARSTGHPRFLYEAGEYGEFEKAARARMFSTDNANRELVLFYAGAGKRPAEALEIARREAALRHDVLTLDALAVALHANGKFEESRKVMRRVLATGTRLPGILRHAAQIGVKPE